MKKEKVEECAADVSQLKMLENEVIDLRTKLESTRDYARELRDIVTGKSSDYKSEDSRDVPEGRIDEITCKVKEDCRLGYLTQIYDILVELRRILE